MAFQFQFPAGSFQKRLFQFQFPAGSFKKRLFQFQFPAGSFKKRLFQFQFPAGSFKKGAMRGQKRGVCKGAWPSFTKKGLKVAVLVQFRRTSPPKKTLFDSCISLQRVGLRNSQPAVSKNGFFSFNFHWALQFIEGLLPTRVVFPVSISGRQFQKTAFPVSIPSRQFQKTAF